MIARIEDLTPLRKIFCWVQDPHNDKIAPHGLAMGEDGVMLAITPANKPSTVMSALSEASSLFDAHFGKNNWCLIFVPKHDVETVGANLDFECAIGKNALLAQKAGLQL